MTLNSSKPIFIAGCPRSGTTLLASRLNQHSQIAVTPETHFFEILNRKFFQILEYPISEKKIRKLFALRRFQDFDIDVDKLIEVLKRKEKTSFNVFDACMNLYRLREKKLFWCEKTPQNLKYLKYIFEFYPDAKVICIIRDGRDVAVSLSKVPWRERNLIVPALEWNEYAIVLLRAKSQYSENNLMVIKFEELIQDPDKTLKTICDFLDVEFENTMISPPHEMPGLLPQWELQWKCNALGKFDKDRVGGWKNMTNCSHKMILNTAMEENLKKFDYEYNFVKLSHNQFLKAKMYIAIGKLIKPVFDFIEAYSKFRGKAYHPF